MLLNWLYLHVRDRSRVVSKIETKWQLNFQLYEIFSYTMACRPAGVAEFRFHLSRTWIYSRILKGFTCVANRSRMNPLNVLSKRQALLSSDQCLMLHTTVGLTWKHVCRQGMWQNGNKVSKRQAKLSAHAWLETPTNGCSMWHAVPLKKYYGMFIITMFCPAPWCFCIQLRGDGHLLGRSGPWRSQLSQ